MEAHAIIICLSLLYHMHTIRWCAVLFSVPKLCYATVYGWAREVVGESERASELSKEIGLEHYACSLPSVSQ